MLGTGIIRGLVVTARNFLGSFYDRRRFVTVFYPEQKVEMPERFRSFPFLVYDGEDAVRGLRCVACKICEKNCPPQCIYIVQQRDEKGKPLKHPAVFDLDISVCMSCGICVEVCPFDSIKMDKVFEVAESARFEKLLFGKAALSKSNAYYRSVSPADAGETDARLEEEKKAAAAKAQAAAQKKSAAQAQEPQ